MDRVIHWLERIEDFFDQRGKGAWIAAFVLGFILFWPIGLSILAYTLWSGRMGCWKNRRTFRSNVKPRFRSTGNMAFDEYREETLRRLEEEHSAFEEFLDNLRRAKDKAQFDEFMRDRRNGGPRTEEGTAAA